MGYVLAIGCDRRVPTAAGQMRADTLAGRLPKGAWQRLSADPGANGQRYYDWALITLTAGWGHHWLLVRRHPRHGELAFYRATARPWSRSVSWSASLDVDGPSRRVFRLVRAWPGSTSTVRRWLAWRRWTLLAMLAHALLAVIAAAERAGHPPQPELIALTCNEIRRLFTKLITEPTRRLTDTLAWSHWRRHH